MKNKFTNFILKTTFQSTPLEIYNTWLDGDLHAVMTGAKATGQAKMGTEFTAWDGYISGKNVDLDPGKRIVQSCRTTEFMPGDEDSVVEIDLKPLKTGCELILKHSKIPPNQSDYKQGWLDFYFKPMSQYFKKI